MYIQARNNGLGEIEWSNILKDIVGGYTAYKTASTQADILKLQAQQQIEQQKAQQAMLAYQFSPQYSPQYGAPTQQQNLMPILLLGGAALLVFFLMKD